jgi:penicillin-binding protein 1A
MSRRERKRRRQRRRGHPLRRTIVVSVLLVLATLGIGAGAVVGWVAAVANSAPNLSQLKPRNPGQLSEIFAADGQPLGYITAPTLRTPVSGSKIPQVVKNATVAIEDRRFWHHGALDYTGILRAAIKDVFNGGATLQGASTLTMQLVDNLYLGHVTHNLQYKIKQAKLAQELYNKHSKSWILDSYLNDVPYGTVGGQTAYGVGAASRLFFDKPVWKLDLAQAALLAGLPQAPSQYNPFLYPGPARERRLNVLQAMVQSHYITPAQAEAANAEPLQVKHSSLFDRRSYRYAFDYIVQELHQRFCPGRPPTAPCRRVDEGGLKIYSTIVPHDMQLAQQAVLAHEGGPGQPAAALAAVQPGTGNLVAIANTSSYQKSSFDYATQGHRQPGSAFKVFALMTLIHDYDGDPSKTFYNSHFLAPGWLPSDPSWSVHTAERSYQGAISITKATIISDNTVFAQLVVDLGMAKFDRMARAMGITSNLNGNPAEVIGGLTYGVTPLEMADAYSTLASGGVHVPVHAVSKIVYPNGRTVNFAEPHKRVFSDGEAYAATKVLEQVILQGTGTAANYGCPAAGKTGTAENLANAWFVGYTPKLTTAVWVGYPQGNIGMPNGFGGTLAAPIWHDFMHAASGGYCGNFALPAVPWQGSAFKGPHSVARTQPTHTVPTGTVPPPGSSTNPQLFSSPPQGPPPAVVPGAPPPKHNNGKPPNSGGGGPPNKHHP